MQAGAAAEIPDWVPDVAGVNRGAPALEEAEGRVSVSFGIETSESIDRLAAACEKHLRRSGFQVERRDLTAGRNQTVVLRATSGARSLTVWAVGDGSLTRGSISYSHPA